MIYLLDANILSERTKPVPDENVLKCLNQHIDYACTSATVWFELLSGIELLPEGRRKTQLNLYIGRLEQFGLPVLPFDKDAARWLAVESARLSIIGLTPAKSDSEIAAVAVVNGLRLVTRNTKDFDFFAELLLENWFLV